MQVRRRLYKRELVTWMSRDDGGSGAGNGSGSGSGSGGLVLRRWAIAAGVRGVRHRSTQEKKGLRPRVEHGGTRRAQYGAGMLGHEHEGKMLALLLAVDRASTPNPNFPHCAARAQVCCVHSG